jgi:hypothetical protein
VPINLTLLSKPGCHLCEAALVTVETVIAGYLAQPVHAEVLLEVVNILDDAQLQNRYAEEIPVLLINGEVHNYWRIDEQRLRAALDAATTKA